MCLLGVPRHHQLGFPKAYGLQPRGVNALCHHVLPHGIGTHLGEPKVVISRPQLGAMAFNLNREMRIGLHEFHVVIDGRQRPRTDFL